MGARLHLQACALTPFKILARFIAAALCLAVSLTPLNAAAWGEQGHKLVAEVAQSRLTPDAAREVARLLALDPDGARQLADIANWADHHKSGATARWHYVNLPPDCSYVPPRDCPNGQCMVAAIERQERALRQAHTDLEKLAALKYLTHLVGDAFQPLHAGRAEDKGGNTYQVRAFGRGTNLHSLWDTGLIESQGVPFPAHAAQLKRLTIATASATRSVAGPEDWARTSCQIASSPDFYPSGHKLSSTYSERWSPVVDQQLARAGFALAAVLNEALAMKN